MKMLKHIAPLASLALVAACSNGGDVDEQAEMTPDQTASSAPADTATEPTETTAPTTTPGSDAAAPLASGTWQVVDTRLTRPGGVQAIGDAELEAARSLRCSLCRPLKVVSVARDAKREKQRKNMMNRMKKSIVELTKKNPPGYSFGGGSQNFLPDIAKFPRFRKSPISRVR